jgi:DNA-binding transcriptional LysR family regulator
VGRELTLERFLQLRHAMYWTTGSQYRAVEHALATLNLSHDVMLRAPRFSALPFLIARSDLVVTVPEDLGVAFARLLPVKVFEPPLPLGSFQIKQYWHARLHAEPAHRWLRKLVREETGKLGRRQPAGTAALPPSPQNPATRPSRRGSLAQT